MEGGAFPISEKGNLGYAGLRLENVEYLILKRSYS